MSTNIDTTEGLDRILRVVRDAGALDDNMGAEDWTQSDKSIVEAKQAILDWVNEEVVKRDDWHGDLKNGYRRSTVDTIRNDHRAEQRKILTRHGWKESK